MSQTAAPGWFTLVVVAAIIWNLLGIASFGMQVTISPEALAALPEAERALHESTPLWLNIVFGTAVIAGTLGSFCLLLKKSLALPLFAVSLIAVVIQMSYGLLFTESIAIHGASALVMPMLVTAIAVYLWLLSRQARSKGWCS